jgi:hypothetical protein
VESTKDKGRPATRARKGAKANTPHANFQPREEPAPWQRFCSEVGQVTAHVEALVERARELGIMSRFGFEGTGPHETEVSRDVAAALFVALRSLEVLTGFVHPLGPPRHWRDQIRGAHNVLRGGRPDGAPNADRTMAVDMARQALMFAYGIAFKGRNQNDAVAHIRSTYSALFGSVFERAPDDATILAHLSKTSKAGAALADGCAGRLSPEDVHRALALAALALAADVVWAGHAEAGSNPTEAEFRFPWDAGDTTRPKLLARLRAAVRDAGRPRKRAAT